jgi:Bacterial Ig-like domain (group 2)
MHRSTWMGITRSVGLVALLASSLVLVLPAQIVRAATITVTLQTDSDNACATSGAAPCSLRDAVTYANAHAGTTISVPAGTYTLTHGDTSDGGSGLVLSASMTILGAGAGSTIIQANATANTATYRVMHINRTNVTMQSVTIRNGAGSAGGGISSISSTLTVMNSTLSGNTAADSGGGIYNVSGTLTVTNSTLSSDSAPDYGGGIANVAGMLTVANSTLSGNSAGIFGGNIFSNSSSTVNMTNTIVASSSSGDLSGSFIGDYNLVDDNTIGNLSGTGNINQPAQLGPLQFNGGPTQTMAPAFNSPAVDAIPLANCTATIDQRSTPRPQGSKCDIGAVELLTPTLALNNASGAPGSTVTFSGAGFRTGLSLSIGGTNATVGTVAPDGASFTATVPSPHASGNVSITVTNPDTTHASATFTYTSATLTSIAVTPANPSIAQGTTQQFTATGTYSDTTTADITNSVTWQSVTTHVATISNTAGSKGLATGVGTGTSTIKATLGSVTSNNQTLTVTAATLMRIAVTPANPQIAKGTTQQFSATGTYSDGSQQNLTASVTWASSDPTKATINTSGLATGATAGTTTISATLSGITGNTSFAVRDATLVTIAITPANPTIANGMTEQFTATGTYSDTTTADITNSVTWSSTIPATATIASTGFATGVGMGTSTIQAALNGVTGGTTLTVTASVLASIAVTPANPQIATGTTQQFTAIGTYSDGSDQDLTGTVAWASTTTSVATITANGLASGTAAGTTTISATQGSITGNTSIAVTDARLVSIAVTPGNVSIAKGTSQQFTATGSFSDGTQ